MDADRVRVLRGQQETWRTSEAVSHIKSYIILTLEVGEWCGKMAEFEDQPSDSVTFD